LDSHSLNDQVRDAWDQNAAFWDEKMAEGNQFQRILIGPASERLLDLKPGELVLEIASGNGVFARRMAQLGAQVVATDLSEKMLEQAQKRGTEFAGHIQYTLADATDEEQLLSLGKRRFDAIVCNMAIMDMTTIEPLMNAASQLLKADGRFVFSVMHPCFNSAGTKMTAEEEDTGGDIKEVHAIKISKYIGQTPQKGIGIIGQPVPQYYFFRTLSDIFNTCFRAGFVLDGIEEPAFGDEDAGNYWFSWANYKGIPPVLVARLRPRDKPRALANS
jgi:2-polyprenyl-3-methyl-5-hydroxy-6-metoxy-1,4-benzoquinol methylase